MFLLQGGLTSSGGLTLDPYNSTSVVVAFGTSAVEVGFLPGTGHLLKELASAQPGRVLVHGAAPSPPRPYPSRGNLAERATRARP